VDAGSTAFNHSELLADAKDDFIQLESAISAGSPERCRGYLGAELYEQLVGTVRDLAHRGCRRVHGAFEILAGDVVGAEPVAGEALPQVTVRLHATSSLLELDRQDRVAQGSTDLMAWTQDLVLRRDLAAGRWTIHELGPMSVQGPVTGPSGPPLESGSPSDLEKRERQSEEHAAAFLTATLTFMSLQYPPR
jgi:hypothetical protein